MTRTSVFVIFSLTCIVLALNISYVNFMSKNVIIPRTAGLYTFKLLYIIPFNLKPPTSPYANQFQITT